MLRQPVGEGSEAMAQQRMVNPIELYEAAVNYMRPIIAGVKPGQLSSPTPCTEWSVQALINHNIKVAQMYHSEFTRGGPVDPMAVSGPLPPEGAEVAFVAGTNRVLAAVKASGALDRILDTRLVGKMPGRNLLMLPVMDLVVHKWDLAKATNQDSHLDSALAEVCYQVLAARIEQARQAGRFGPEVVVPANASIQDKLLGLSGRQP